MSARCDDAVVAIQRKFGAVADGHALQRDDDGFGRVFQCAMTQCAIGAARVLGVPSSWISVWLENAVLLPISMIFATSALA